MLLDLPQQDPGNLHHSSLDLTKIPTPQQAVGELNLSMLLPVPQYHRADKLKPIIDFLGEESGGKNQTSLGGENLPVPKDSHPVMSDKKDSSTPALQDGIKPSRLAVQNGISSLRSSSQSTQANVASTLGLPRGNDGEIQAVNHDVTVNLPPSKTVALQTPSQSAANPMKQPPASTVIEPLQSVTEGLVKSFLTSKFGQALGKGLLDFDKNGDSSYKNILAQHFGSSVKTTASPTNKTPPNQDLIANLVSGLTQRPSEHDSTANPVSNKNNEKIFQPVKQDFGATDNLSSPTVSIGNKVFSLTDFANSLLNENQDPNESKSVNTDIEWKKGSRRHQGKQRNKDKIRKLDEKIATLETLSDALDALTTKLSPDENSEDQNQKEPSFSSDRPTIQEPRHKKHHTHHHKNDQFSEDLDMLGALLARGPTSARAEKKKPFVSKDDKDSNYIMGIKGKKALSSADLQVLQNKINQAIEMAEAEGRQHDPTKQSKPTYTLLSAGKVGEDVVAQTREEVATIHPNQAASKRMPPSKNGELQSLQDILTGLINNAMRKGTLNQLVQRWNRNGSPFADIAKNISLYLQGNKKLKTQVSTLEIKQTFPTQATTKTGIDATAQTNVTAQMAEGLAGLTAEFNNTLFTKAVNNILGALSKRQGLHKSNSTNRSSFVTTNTLTNFKGVLLGGRINKLKHIPQTAELESKLMAEVWKGHGNKTFLKNSSKLANLTVGNNAEYKSDNKIDMLRDNHTLPIPLSSGHGKEKLTYSTYETKNVSKTVRNDTLMDFMKSMEEPKSPEHLTENNKSRNDVGDKYSQVKPHINDLMSVIVSSLLNLNDIEQDSLPKGKPKITYEESGNEKLLHGLPNDHKTSDFSRDDAVLEAPTDHAVETNSSNKRPQEQHNATQSSTNVILLRNNTKDYIQNEKPKDPDEQSQKLDLGDQTVTLTLETVDEAPTPAPQTNQGSKTLTGLRNNKVPHNLNVQSALTMGKINATDSRNMAQSFAQTQIQEVPTTFSDFATEKKEPTEIALPSDGDGKLTSISPSPEVNPKIGGDFQAKSKPELPLGLQMNAIGRIAETDDKTSPTPADLSAALTNPSGFSSLLASKNGETKSFEDKILPMASDLTSLTDAKSGETESIVSKASPVTLQNPATIKKPSNIAITPEKESRPTASEVREIATSIKALLKILNSYSKKLRIEDQADDSTGGMLPTRSRTVNRVSINEGENTSKEDSVKPTNRGLPAARYNSNVYANFPQSAITIPKYVDSGVFENIREQPSVEENSYDWNIASVRAHPQMPFDINPTKTSIEPQLGADQWRPGNEMGRVTDELKDLNLPSIEDDPTVRAVQNIVAEENSFLNEKRKAIQKHKQQDSRVKSQLPGRPRVVGRNVIPKHKGHHRNQSRMEHKKRKMKVGNFRNKSNDEKKQNVRGRDVIPRINNDKLSRQNASAFGKRKLAIIGNTTHHGNKLSSSPPRMMGNSSKKTSLVSSRDKVAGGNGNRKTSNDSVPATNNKKTTFKTKHNLKGSLPTVHPNSTSMGAVNALKINVQRNPEAKQSRGEILPHRLNNTQVTGVKRKSGKTYATPKEIVTNNGTLSKPEHVKAFKAKNRTS